MGFQKLTVLDAARIAGEISAMKGSKVSEVLRDDSRTRLIIRLVKSDTALKLVLEKQYAYLGLTGDFPESLTDCFWVLDGFTIKGCQQINNDRIIRIEFEKKDRLGRDRTLYLIFEMISGRGNVYLIEQDGRILEMLKRKKLESYVPPEPMSKPSVFNFDDAYLRETVKSGKDIPVAILGLSDRDVANLSPLFAENPQNAGIVLAEYVNEAIKPGPAWVIKLSDENAGFSLIEPELRDGETAGQFDTALTMYDYYFEHLNIEAQSHSELEKLQKTLEVEIAKIGKKLSAIEGDLAESEKAMIYKAYGELLLANSDKIEKGATAVKLKNLEKDGPRYFDIELDPTKSVSVNAAGYFKKYKKAASSQKSLAKRLDETKARLSSLEELKERAFDSEDDLLKGLQALGVVRPESRKSARQAPPPRKPYRTFKASCGWEILVGKSNADNDELSLHIARKDDYWFHAWQASGSHVVLRLPDKSAVPEKQTLLEAASLAAYYSKARGSSKVPVAYTQARYVRKPKKFPPGKVLVEREKQLMVRPADPKEFGGDNE